MYSTVQYVLQYQYDLVGRVHKKMTHHTRPSNVEKRLVSNNKKFKKKEPLEETLFLCTRFCHPAISLPIYIR